jgi:putative ABC transport system permease protein
MIYRVITPGYLETLHIPLIAGRFFDDRDRQDAPPVAIINERAARELWPNQDSIGKRVKLGPLGSGNPWMQVIGVTRDVKHSGLTEDDRQEIYCPYLQAKSSSQWQRSLVVRTSCDPMGIVTELRQIAAAIDSDEPVNHAMNMSELVEREMSQSLTQTMLLGALAGLALAMACVGIYGVMAYMVAQRTQEIGVRMALGAQPRSILTLILGHGTKLALVGICIGLVAALLSTRLMNTLLFRVSPIDPLTFAVVPVVLLSIALLACYLPARHATKIDPVVAFRSE